MTADGRAAITERLQALVHEALGASERNVDVEIDETAFLPDVLDSVVLAALITMIEDQWGIEIADEEITIDELASLDTIAEFVVQKLGPHGS